MPRHWTLTALLILLLFGVVKTGQLFIKLAMMMGMGLMGMYLLHKLSQDYTRIRGPMKAVAATGRLLGLWKRSLPDDAMFGQLRTEPPIPDPFKVLDEKLNEEDPLHNFHPNFDMALSFDQNECARRLVCQLATMNHLNQNEVAILKLIKLKPNQKESRARVVFEEAANVGYKSQDPKKCKEVFKKCRISERLMQRVVRVF